MALGVNGVMTVTIVALTPLLLWLFSLNQKEHRMPLRSIPREIWQRRYLLHVATYLAMISFKTITDRFNEPLKGQSGDYTHIIYALEGKTVLFFQKAFENPVLTNFLNYHYLFIYLFIILFTTAYFMYTMDQEMADKAAMNYVMIYVLAVPYYLFFNVEVTSSYIPGMNALLYHDSAVYFEFFTTHDPLDNAFPSLHMAIPMGLLMINYLHLKEKGIKLRNWRHKYYHYVVLANLAVFGFSILYLGIHWLTDIVAGFILAMIGAFFVHAIQPKLRNMRLPKVRRQLRNSIANLSLQSFMVLLLVGLLTFTLQYQADAHHERPSMLLGPQDTNIDVFEPVTEGEAIHVKIVNLHPTIPVQGVLLERSASSGAIVGGFVNWTSLAENRELLTFNPNTTTELKIAGNPEEWWVLLVHNPAEIPEDPDEASQVDPATIKVVATYPGNAVPQATMLSIPSLLATIYVLHRLLRMWQNEEPWYSSRPSADWVVETVYR